MSEKVNLIDCYSGLGTIQFHSPAIKEPIIYHVESVLIAYHRTIEELRLLENNAQTMHNSNCGMVLSMWFVSIEKYINTILRLVAQYKKISCEEIEKQINKHLTDRVIFILDRIEHDKKNFYQNSKIFQLLKDFCTFRNEYLHNRDRNQTYQTAVFSSRSSNPICSDLIQAMLIFINITTCFRYTFHTIDFMPAIPLTNRDGAAKYEFLDTIYLETIKPYIQDILNKLDLCTDIIFDIDPYTIKSPFNRKSDLFVIKAYMIKADNETIPKISSEKSTNFFLKYYDNLLKKNPAKDGIIIMPKLTRNIKTVDGQNIIDNVFLDK